MVKSKAWSWDWDSSVAPWWEEPAPEAYPLLTRWSKARFKNFLDLGCGIGRHAVLFADNNFNVNAFDLSEEGINKLKILSQSKNLLIKTKIGDMLSLPYKDDFFDCIIAYHVIYHADDNGIKKAISEIKRVLKKDGEAYLTFNSQNGTSFKDPDNKHITQNTIIKEKGHEARIPHFYSTKQDVENLLKDFKILEFTYKEEYYPNYIGAHYFVLVKKV
jgi:SAM-dependent methyltransferase